MRAPAPSLMPISGRPVLMASSCTLTIFAVDLAQAAAEHRCVLAEDADLAAVDGAVTGHYAVTDRAVLLQTEVGAAMPGECVEFGERIFVEQGQDSLPAVSLPLEWTLSTAPSPTGCSVSSARRRRSASLPAVVWMSAWVPASVVVMGDDGTHGLSGQRPGGDEQVVLHRHPH